MKKVFRKLTASVLVCSIMLPFSITAFADSADNGQASTFDFSASDYAFNESDGAVKIKLVRKGSGDGAARVTFKAADMLSTYGEDYEILDSKGKTFKKVEGFVPDVNDFTFSENGEDIQLSEETKNELAETADKPTKTTVKKRSSTGVPVLDAQAEYLDLPSEWTDEEVEDNTRKVLDEMYDYLTKAQGAVCTVDFGIGEMEKEVTVNIKDNDVPNAQRVFVLAVMATDDEKAVVAPNATTYVTIEDNEPQEQSTYSLVTDNLRLTSAKPEGQVVVERNGGLQYFSTVSVSTVTQTAPDGSYENFQDKTIAFVPGQTEATVDVKALSFDKGGEFGIRLELDCESDVVDNHYVPVTIVKNDGLRERTPEEIKALEGSGAKAETETLAVSTDGIVLGDKTTTYDVGSFGSNVDMLFFSTGGYDIDHNYLHWSPDSETYWNRLRIGGQQYGVFDFYTKNSLDFTGIKTLNGKYHIWTNGLVGSTVGKYQNDMNEISGAVFTKDYRTGFHNKTENFTVNVSNCGQNCYLHNILYKMNSSDVFYGEMEFSHDYTVDWAKYTFDFQPSVIQYSRDLYDFTTGAPEITHTYFDGMTTAMFTPGEVIAKDSDGNVISGFYGNCDKVISFYSNDEKAAQNGLFLDGVYIVNSSKTSDNMGSRTNYDPKDKYVYIPVEDSGKGTSEAHATVTLDLAFVKTLTSSGVISAGSKDENIKIFPKYSKGTRKVRIYNTDKPKGTTKYDSDNRYSEFENILDAYSASVLNPKALKVEKVSMTWPEYEPMPEGIKFGSAEYTKWFNRANRRFYDAVETYKDWADEGGEYYEIEVPLYSVIRLSVNPTTGKYANGATYQIGRAHV